MPGPWERYRQQAGSQDPIIAPPDPYKQRADQRAQQDQLLQQEAAARAREEQARQQAKFEQDRVDAENKQRQLDVTGGIDASVEQGRAAAFALRAQRANAAFEGAGLDPDSMIGATASQSFPRATAALSSDERNAQRSREKDFIAAVLRYESGAAIPPAEFETAYQIYFPNENAGPEEIEAKRQARANAVEGLRLGAGPNVARIEAPSEPPRPDETTAGGSDRKAQIVAFWNSQRGNPNLTPELAQQFYQSLGVGADSALIEKAVDAAKRGLPFVSYPDQPQGPTEAERIANDPRVSEPDAAVLARQGFTLGLSDEAAGVGGAIGNLIRLENPVEGYQLWRDVERAQLDRARGNLGGFGTAIEVGSGFGGVGNAAQGANALFTLGQGVRTGAGIGALGGFGYGEGLEGSTINALGGAALGGALGGGGQVVANALAPRLASGAADVAARGQRAVDLSRAGQAEGVTVNRAMVDPALANRVTGVDATLTGGPRIQREMRAIEGQVEGRVADLGQGGRAMNEVTGGQAIEGAGKRFIERSGAQARRKYDRAERLAGNARVEPVESLRRVDEMLATLQETPGTNAKEIAFLETLRSDLGSDLSVGALRRMRTAMRRRISRGELTFGEDEARVLAIMDGAADDIRAGLTAQGKAQAARAFDVADKAYRARMDYISGTLQRIMGRRNANQPAEQAWRKFEAMASSRGDAIGLKRFYATLTPEERADVAATFAEDLGKNNAGEFSVAHFLSQSEKLSDDAIETIFGPQGAESIRNLRALGSEVKRVTGAMNSRTSKTGVANNYRDWLYNLLLGGIAGGGGAITGGSTAAIAGAGAALGANALRSALTARSLTSPNIARWIAQAPRTASPKAIDNHFARLSDIAKAEPALAGEIESLRNAIMQAANDNPASRLAAEDQDAKEN